MTFVDSALFGKADCVRSSVMFDRLLPSGCITTTSPIHAIGTRHLGRRPVTKRARAFTTSDHCSPGRAVGSRDQMTSATASRRLVGAGRSGFRALSGQLLTAGADLSAPGDGRPTG